MKFKLHQDRHANWTATCEQDGRTFQATGAFPTSAMGNLMENLSRAGVIEVEVSTESNSTYVQRTWAKQESGGSES